MMLDQEQRTKASDYDKIVGWRIRERRVALGITLDELAQETELDEALLSCIEEGTQCLTPWMMMRLVPTLRMNASYLLGFTSHPCSLPTYLWG